MPFPEALAIASNTIVVPCGANARAFVPRRVLTAVRRNKQFAAPREDPPSTGAARTPGAGLHWYAALAGSSHTHACNG